MGTAPYLINVGNMRQEVSAEPESVLLTWALSAGPNGIIETPDYTESDLNLDGTSEMRSYVRGDDIGRVAMNAFGKPKKSP
jgi:hypothetical protein